jgi:hypothetical protein
MYNKGDATTGDFWSDSKWYDESDEEVHPYEGKQVIRLPHSCDSWVIGGEKEARQMIADLEEAIKKL